MRFLVLALLAHVAILASLRKGEVSAAQPPRAGELVLLPVETAEAPSIPPPVSDERPVSDDPVRAPAPRTATAARATVVTAPAERGEAAVATAAFSPFAARPVDLALGRAAPVDPPGESPPEPAPRPRAPSATDSVRSALEERDVELGLTPDGPTIRALEQATHASHVALVSEAVFEATVDASGLVTSLSLVAGDEAWSDVRERALRIVAGKVAGHHGREATFRLRVVSRLIGPPAGLLAKAGAVLFLELEALHQTQQRVVHVQRVR